MNSLMQWYRRDVLQQGALAASVLVLLLGHCATGQAQERSGWEFFRQATLYANPSSEAPNADVFTAEFNSYLWGAAHILQQQGTVCLPDAVALNALWLPVYQVLKDNPEQRKRSRSSLVAELLPALYPCTAADVPPHQPPQ
ncbi:MAG: Rap1a/Tai family immunity protein [Halioglobus sp.]